jgi:hypothetical protein
MQLDHIKDEKCPTCGAIVIVQKKKDKHTNGHWNETVEFQCGAVIKWSPNYMRINKSCCQPCPNSSEETTKKELRRIAISKLVEYINKLDVDKECKESLLNDLSWRIC